MAPAVRELRLDSARLLPNSSPYGELLSPAAKIFCGGRKLHMTFPLSRRKLLGTGGLGLAGAALLAAAPNARADAGSPSSNKAIVQAWYQLWLTSTDWAPFDAMLTDDFAFSSTNGEDRINKEAYKAHVWAPNIGRIARFDPVLIMAQDDAVFVKFFGYTKSGNTFLNVELHRLRDEKIASIECYFGSKMAFPAAVDSK